MLTMFKMYSLYFSVLILLAILFMNKYRKQQPLLDIDPEDDIRENVVFYNEEGAGNGNIHAIYFPCIRNFTLSFTSTSS